MEKLAAAWHAVFINHILWQLVSRVLYFTHLWSVLSMPEHVADKEDCCFLMHADLTVCPQGESLSSHHPSIKNIL